MSNYETFRIILANKYENLFTKQEYALAAKWHTPASLASKMTQGLLNGNTDKDGEGIKQTCKTLGIKHTYKAITEYLKG